MLAPISPPSPSSSRAESVYEDPRTSGYVPIECVAPKELVDELCRRFPVLERRPDFLRLAVHCLVAAPVEDGIVAIPLPYRLIAALAGKSKQAKSRNFSAKDFLGEFDGAMANGAVRGETFQIAVRGYREGRCRRLVALRVPHDLRQASLAFKQGQYHGRLVHVTPSGVKLLGPKQLPAWRKRRIASAKTHSTSPQTARDLQRYLHKLPLQPFTKIASKEAITAAFGEAEHLYASEPAKLNYARLNLASIARQPMPVYRTTSNSVRLFATGHSLASLPKPLRHLLSSRARWIELDLAQSQLAITSSLWKVEPVLDALRDEDFSIWDDLMRGLGVAPDELRRDDPQTYAEVKAALKPNVYGILFGASAHDLRRFGFAFDFDPHRTDAAVLARRALLVDTLGRPLDELGDAFVEHPLMAAMLEARHRRMEELRRDGHIVDAFGRRLALVSGGPDEVRPPSLLAQEAQAMELKLLEPVTYDAIEESEKLRPNYRITLWQHDGFSIVVKEKRLEGPVIERLQQLVQDAADSLDIPTRLVVTR